MRFPHFDRNFLGTHSIHLQKFSTEVLWAFFQFFTTKAKPHFLILKKGKKKKKIRFHLCNPPYKKAGSRSVNKTDLTKVLLSRTVVKSGVDQLVLNL